MLITFSGTIGSGKTTCTDYLAKKYGFATIALADPLKFALKELFMFEDEQLYGNLEQKEAPDPRWFGVSPRQIMQFVGTDLFRNQMEKIMPGINEDFFVHRFKLWYEPELNKNPNLKLIVSDIRFINEADYVTNMGGTVIKLIRLKTTDIHQSETECEKINGQFEIHNCGTLDDLYKKIDQIMISILSLDK